MLYQYSTFRDFISSASSDDSKHMSMRQKCKQGFSYSSLEAWFSLAHKRKHKNQKNGQVCLSLCLRSENGIDISTSISTIGPIVGHFEPDLMWTYQKQYGGRFSAILFIIGLRRAGIENWVKYAILRMRICSYAYAYALVKTRLKWEVSVNICIGEG